jgi:hypothetical protein
MARKKPRGGRPLRDSEGHLRKNRTFRIRDRLDAMLEQAAMAAGRSTSEEIEFRLERTFYDDRMAARFLGSDIASEALRLIRGAMVVEGIAGRDWAEDPQSAEAVRVATNAIIAVLANLPLDPPPPEKRVQGLQIAKDLLLRSSKRGELPNELMFSDLERLDFGGSGDDSR